MRRGLFEMRRYVRPYKESNEGKWRWRHLPTKTCAPLIPDCNETTQGPSWMISRPDDDYILHGKILGPVKPLRRCMTFHEQSAILTGGETEQNRIQCSELDLSGRTCTVTMLQALPQSRWSRLYSGGGIKERSCVKATHSSKEIESAARLASKS